MHRPSPALSLATCIALLAGLLTAAQSGFILLRGDSFCLNDGCRVVEELTRVPPLVVNLAGLLFFLTVLAGLRAARDPPRVSRLAIALSGRAGRPIRASRS